MTQLGRPSDRARLIRALQAAAERLRVPGAMYHAVALPAGRRGFLIPEGDLVQLRQALVLASAELSAEPATVVVEVRTDS
jgi:hypothetical protein